METEDARIHCRRYYSVYAYRTKYIILLQNQRTTLALRSPQGEVRPGRWRLDEGDISFMYVARDKNARIHKL